MQPAILVADSCACGLALFDHYDDLGPFRWIYLADGLNNPFGTKTQAEVASIVYSWLLSYREQNLTALVIACNTASLAARQFKTEWEREFGITIIDMFDGLDVEAGGLHRMDRIAVMGTPLTIETGIYRRYLEQTFPDKTLIDLPAPVTERLVARNLWHLPEERRGAADEIAAYRTNDIEALVLACTCYEMAAGLVTAQLGRILLLNPMVGVARVLRQTVDRALTQDPGRFLGEPILRPLDNISVQTTGNLQSWLNNLNDMGERLFSRRFVVTQAQMTARI